MNNSRNEEGKRPRKRFIKRAAELVRSVKLSRNKDEGTGSSESYISASARKFNDLFSKGFNIQPQ